MRPADSAPHATGVAIVVNGKPRALRTGATVSSLLTDANLDPIAVFVEYNDEPLERERFSTTEFKEGDRIEIAQMVGGG